METYPNIGKVSKILAESMDTNLTAANIAYFIRQALMCNTEDINFYTAPNTPQDVQQLSYTFLDLYNWIDLVNSTINPYTTPVSEGNLDLVYLHNGAVSCTTVLNGAYYYQLGQQESAPARSSLRSWPPSRRLSRKPSRRCGSRRPCRCPQ